LIRRNTRKISMSHGLIFVHYVRLLEIKKRTKETVLSLSNREYLMATRLKNSRNSIENCFLTYRWSTPTHNHNMFFSIIIILVTTVQNSSAAGEIRPARKISEDSDGTFEPSRETRGHQSINFLDKAFNVCHDSRRRIQDKYIHTMKAYTKYTRYTHKFRIWNRAETV